jgi:hypothetical protein
LVTFLIKLGANVNCKDSEGKRPLDCLFESTRGDIAEVAIILTDKLALPKPERLNRFKRGLNRPNSETRPKKNEHPKVQNSSSRER